MFSLNDCKFRSFREILIFVTSVIMHIGNVKERDLRTSANSRVILPFCESFFFMINKTLAKFSEFTVQIHVFESYLLHAGYNFTSHKWKRKQCKLICYMY